MKSNSNFNITKVTVDPISQEITELEVNGKPFESGGEANLESISFDAKSPLNVASIFGENPSAVEIHPNEGWDGIEQVTIMPEGLTGYPGEGLEITNDPSTSADVPSEITIMIPEGEAWTGTITLIPNEEP